MTGIQKKDIDIINTYNNGLPFTNSIEIQIDSMRKRVNMKMASLTIIDGAMGSGKSTLAVEAAEYYQGYDLDFSCQYSMGGNDFMAKFEDCIRKKRPVIIYDEGGDFDKRSGVSGFNKRLNRMFQTFRTFKIFVIIVLPCFDVLDKYMFLAAVPRLLLHCSRDNMKYSKVRVYGYAEMMWIKKIIPKAIPPARAYMNIKPNTIGYFRKLPKDKQTELDNISSASKKSILVDNIVASKDLISMDDMATHFNLTKRHIRILIKGIKGFEGEIHHRKKYYSKAILPIIDKRINKRKK